MTASDSLWRTQELSDTYLDGVRGAIPLAEAQIEVMLKVIDLWRPHPQRVVDLGCGDGILGRAVLERYPGAHVTFADFSEPMLAAAREKTRSHEAVQIVQVDFSSPDWQANLATSEGYDLVLSGYSIHHQPDERKRALYAEIYDLLAPGGVLLNLEHVASPTGAVGDMFDDYFIDHLYAFHLRSEADKSRHEVAQAYYTRPDKAENILALVETQCDWLREIGFADVDCFFKVFELALFGGRRP